jgi:hypothetical protein
MRYLGLVTILSLLALAVVALALLSRFFRRTYQSRNFSMEDREAWRLKWQQLEKMLDDNPVHWPSAIIEADKLFDAVMKSRKLPGQDTGERYRFLLHDRPALNYVWTARTIRNKIVHESDYILQKKLAKEALSLYERALKDLGVMV